MGRYADSSPKFPLAWALHIEHIKAGDLRAIQGCEVGLSMVSDIAPAEALACRRCSAKSVPDFGKDCALPARKGD